EFEEVMTSENILDVSRALQAGKGFYTVLADLNQQEEIGQVFYEWSRLNSVHLITNVTVFRDEHTLFNFLLATFESLEAVQGAFAEMDPQGRYLSLEKCTLRDGVDLKEAVSVRPVQPVFRQTERTVETGSTVSADALAGFVENVGELVTTRATLHHVTQRLTEMNLVETVTRLVKQSDGDWQRVRKELQTSLEVWADDLDALSRAENELGMALDQFQETALALRARPAAEILDPLQRLVQEVAQHLGKIVELDVTGVDVGLDHSALDVLADPVRRLVWFAVAHSIEKPVQRREAGKPTVGRVSVVVRKTADRAHVVIKDDGCGIDPDAVLNRARELGWTNGDSISAGKLSEWVLKNGFGVVGGSYDVEGIDLVAISAELQAHRGWLNVVSEPGQSTRFSLDVPLDMVVIDGMVMRVGDVRYVVPIEAIRRIVKPEENQIVRSSADGSQSMLRLEEELVPIQILRQGSGQVLIKGQRENFSRAGLLLVVEQNEQSIALAVDELIGQQQVLIQPLQGRLADVQGISGCALLGEGDVGMVLDLNRMNV
ncbi:MAG: chemotaxis protein CheW, partial [Anaerolineae bacterium]